MQAGDWRDWLPAANEVIQDWEASHDGPVLRVNDAALLGESIARALLQAFEDGKTAAR